MTATSTHRATLEQGPPIIDGKLIWTSATGITTADPNSLGGCTRKWHYDTVQGRKAPATKAMRAGTELHTEIENKLLRGTSLQSPLALAGGMFIPNGGSGLYVEKPIHFKTSTGVDIYGHVDIYNLRGEYIDADGATRQDPPWSMEVKDWKTTSSLDYAKTERELSENVQLVTYAEAGFRMWPDLEHSRLTHVYFRTRGAPASKLVTIRRSREEIDARWKYNESVVRIMADAAKEQEVDRVPANMRSCSAYGGCPHATYCSAYRQTSLDELYAKIASDHLQEKETMGLLTQMPQPVTQASLAQEETAMRAQVAQQQAQMFNPAEFLATCTRLGSYGFGMPALGGNAAQAYASAGGQNVAPGFVYQGQMAPQGAQYSLHAMTLTEVAQVYQLEREAAAKVNPQPAPSFPPVQMPANTPPIAQTVANVYNQAVANPALPPTQMKYEQISFLPPGAPESRPELAQQRPAGPPEPYVPGSEPAATPIAPVAEKKRGRPKKSDSGPAPEAAVHATAQTAATPTPTSSAGAATQVTPAAVPTNGSLAVVPTSEKSAEDVGCILVNARFANKSTKSLAGYVDYVNAELSKRYCVTADGKQCPQDVRCAPKDSPLAFGGWKGAVREVVKADPPLPNDYHLDTYLDELNEAVADALRVVAEQRDWLYVRGVRS